MRLLHSVCLPGSHRARRPLPVEQINSEDPLANKGLREDGHLQLLGMRAGDVVVRPFASPSPCMATSRELAHILVGACADFHGRKSGLFLPLPLALRLSALAGAPSSHRWLAADARSGWLAERAAEALRDLRRVESLDGPRPRPRRPVMTTVFFQL